MALMAGNKLQFNRSTSLFYKELNMTKIVIFHKKSSIMTFVSQCVTPTMQTPFFFYGASRLLISANVTTPSN